MVAVYLYPFQMPLKQVDRDVTISAMITTVLIVEIIMMWALS